MFDFLVNTLEFAPENIFIFGRSIGSGPASFLATKRKNAKMLILLSPFTNLKAVASGFVGFLSFFFKDRFNNLECMEKVTCPTIIIHGKKDKIVGVHQSNTLFEAIPHQYKRLIQPYQMTHNRFKLFEDLLNPISKFCDCLPKKDRQGVQVTFPSLELLEIYKSTTIESQLSQIKQSHVQSPFQYNKKQGNSNLPKKKIDIFSESTVSDSSRYDFPKDKILDDFSKDPFS